MSLWIINADILSHRESTFTAKLAVYTMLTYCSNDMCWWFDSVSGQNLYSYVE